MRGFLYWLSDAWPFIALILFVPVLITGAMLGEAYGVERPTCLAHWRDSGLQVRWSLFGDCQLSSDGQHWITDTAFVRFNKQITVVPR